MNPARLPLLGIPQESSGPTGGGSRRGPNSQLGVPSPRPPSAAPGQPAPQPAQCARGLRLSPRHRAGPSQWPKTPSSSCGPGGRSPPGTARPTAPRGQLSGGRGRCACWGLEGGRTERRRPWRHLEARARGVQTRRRDLGAGQTKGEQECAGESPDTPGSGAPRAAPSLTRDLRLGHVA